MKNRILSAAREAGKKAVVAVADRAGVADSKATDSVEWTRTSAKLRAGGIVTAAAAMASEVANPTLSNLLGALLLMLPFDAIAGLETPLGIILSAALGYAMPVVAGYWTREPDTSIRR